MQYFAALKIGQRRVQAAREYLDGLADGRAMPALALKDTKSNDWQPVGEEIRYAFVDESSGFVLTDSSGYILALVDDDGLSKAIVQGITQGQRDAIKRALDADSIAEFAGKVVLPV